MVPDKENGSSWVSMLRMITPVLLLSVNIFAGIMLSNQTTIQHSISQIDDKMFKHLTNDDMHAPRSMMLSKPEFTLYQNMRDVQMSDIRRSIEEVKEMIKETHDFKGGK